MLPTLECWKIKSSSKSLERKRHEIVWPTFTRIIIDLTSSNWVFKLKLSKNRPTSLKTREKREKFSGFVCQINLCVNASLEYAHVEICACSLSLGRNPLVRYTVWSLAFLFPKFNLSCQFLIRLRSLSARGAGLALGMFDMTPGKVTPWKRWKVQLYLLEVFLEPGPGIPNLCFQTLLICLTP